MTQLFKLGEWCRDYVMPDNTTDAETLARKAQEALGFDISHKTVTRVLQELGIRTKRQYTSRKPETLPMDTVILTRSLVALHHILNVPVSVELHRLHDAVKER